MSSQSRSKIQDASRIRYLDTRPFVIHHAHSKDAPEARCNLCTRTMAKGAGIREVEVSRPRVDKSSGADETEAAAPARDYVRLEDLFGSSLREEGKV